MKFSCYYFPFVGVVSICYSIYFMWCSLPSFIIYKFYKPYVLNVYVCACDWEGLLFTICILSQDGQFSQFMDCDEMELQAVVNAIGATTKLNVSNVKPQFCYFYCMWYM
jgi:hypothetical protein